MSQDVSQLKLAEIVYDYTGLQAVEVRDGYGYADSQGQREGPWIFWYPDGTKKEKGMYHHGDKEGKWFSWNHGGWKQTEREFRQGEQVQLNLEWVDGPLVQDHADELATYWHSNGSKREEGYFYQGQREGPWMGWDRLGNVISQQLFHLGMPVG